MNGANSYGMSREANVREKNISNFSSKSSQQNSRKNSVVFKDQFWNSLKSNFLATQKTNKVSGGKENSINMEKERLSKTSK